MKISQDPRWPNAHKTLKTLYEERVPKGTTQADFGAEYGLGTQGIVWQYLNGYTPLNIEAAAKFAKGLGCTIADISPEMAAALQRDILPVVGSKALRAALKAALVMLFSIPPLLAPQRAEAAFSHNASSGQPFFDKSLNNLHIVTLRLYRRFCDWALGHTLQKIRTT